MAIGHLVYPAEKAVPAAIIIYLLLSVVLSIPYVRWRKSALDQALIKTP